MDRMTQILEKLISRTHEGKVNWRPTANPDGFLTTLDTIGVIVSSRSNLGFGSLYKVEIQNEEGVALEIMETPDDVIGFVGQEGVANQEQSRLIERLFQLARQSALKVDSTLEELANHLDAIR